MSVDPKTNEWNLLKHQFDTLAHEASAGADGIEEIFDTEFRRRFTELINQTARRNSTNVYNWPRR
jgi:Mn-dependent DtxR family transcriptional regulator